ncbi:PREDICTED: uncharacterized protein LOC104761044 isoform X2 [Camelina sativa]|uniref:Uncharacterized protein LOC104761044 isoform X2 n=1 Tax=Camelina sativa TaxID=90675 RepID=A0ABM0X8Q8_CAMSA|nr:PREDICTED: uncharacterized protein LOC104761044 isoform X2 [Camelina sativa]
MVAGRSRGNSRCSAGDFGGYSSRQLEMYPAPAWGQRRQLGGESSESGGQRGLQSVGGDILGYGASFHLNRKGGGPVWPKPLYKAKNSSSERRVKDIDYEASVAVKVSGSDVDMEASQHPGDDTTLVVSEFEEETDDLLEDGEYPDGDPMVNGDSESSKGDDTIASHSDAINNLQGDGNKQKVMGIQGNNSTGGKPSGGGRQVKRGMVALPKPPAQT